MGKIQLGTFTYKIEKKVELSSFQILVWEIIFWYG